jgi:hypothetical protein
MLNLVGQQSSSRQRRGAAATYKAADVEAGLRAFLDVAPLEHCKRPHGYYTLEMHLLHAGKERFKTKGAAAAAGAAEELKEIESVYRTGLAAEADLPPFFLPVECGAKDLVGPMLSALRAAANVNGAAAAPAAVKKGSGRAGGGSSSSYKGEGSSSASCCDRCGVAAAKLMRCSRCQQHRFCSKECQVADWKDRHARLCGK